MYTHLSLPWDQIDGVTIDWAKASELKPSVVLHFKEKLPELQAIYPERLIVTSSMAVGMDVDDGYAVVLHWFLMDNNEDKFWEIRGRDGNAAKVYPEASPMFTSVNSLFSLKGKDKLVPFVASVGPFHAYASNTDLRSYMLMDLDNAALLGTELEKHDIYLWSAEYGGNKTDDLLLVPSLSPTELKLKDGTGRASYPYVLKERMSL